MVSASGLWKNCVPFGLTKFASSLSRISVLHKQLMHSPQGLLPRHDHEEKGFALSQTGWKDLHRTVFPLECNLNLAAELLRCPFVHLFLDSNAQQDHGLRMCSGMQIVPVWALQGLPQVYFAGTSTDPGAAAHTTGPTLIWKAKSSPAY